MKYIFAALIAATAAISYYWGGSVLLENINFRQTAYVFYGTVGMTMITPVYANTLRQPWLNTTLGVMNGTCVAAFAILIFMSCYSMLNLGALVEDKGLFAAMMMHSILLPALAAERGLQHVFYFQQSVTSLRGRSGHSPRRTRGAERQRGG